jgi:hypothetical protein
MDFVRHLRTGHSFFMYTLLIDKAKSQTLKDHQYYTFFPKPPTHTNQENRPTEYADEKKLEVYKGKGSNGSAKLHPDVLTAANQLMVALLEYGESINDWSMRSAVIQSGYRPDDESQGRNYLRIINETIAKYPQTFGALKLPTSLNDEAQGVLGRFGDPRRTAFQKKVAESPGWSASLAYQLFQIVDNAYAPRGSNPHATGFVFDLNFWINLKGQEVRVDADTSRNSDALQSAVGMWLNQYSTQFNFDSYDTGIEIWHMEYRKPKAT